jgi:hypothetical protein
MLDLVNPASLREDARGANNRVKKSQRQAKNTKLMDVNGSLKRDCAVAEEGVNQSDSYRPRGVPG